MNIIAPVKNLYIGSCSAIKNGGMPFLIICKFNLKTEGRAYSQKFGDPRIRLIAHVLLAANGHNMQPWKTRLDKDDPMMFYLYADSDRLTNEVDP